VELKENVETLKEERSKLMTAVRQGVQGEKDEHQTGYEQALFNEREGIPKDVRRAE